MQAGELESVLKTYSWCGPAEYHSMIAQIMIRYGLRMVRDGDVHIDVHVHEQGIDLTVCAGADKRKFVSLLDRNTVGRRIHDCLVEWMRQPLGDWGYLQGMRPGKLLYRFFDIPAYKELADQFLNDAKVSPTVADDLVAIGDLQRAYIPTRYRANMKSVVLYIGIPYCPSHCIYCSFPTRAVDNQHAWQRFIDVMVRDVVDIGHLIRLYGLQVKAIYWGGGTPTVLPTLFFKQLLQAVEDCIPFDRGVEYTIEAGRPDTISDEKLDLMMAYGVNRISVNPQTLQDRILKIIHRAHGSRAVESVFRSVKKRNFGVVNMDFIAGLPDQSLNDMHENMNQIATWMPENVTIHTLALKKHSPLFNTHSRYSMPEASETAEMVQLARLKLKGLGYQPYYLYRQKYMSSDLANIGYCLPNTESVYNIVMMGERMHVLGAGPGASNKVMCNSAFQFLRCDFPWNADIYMQEQERYLEKRRGMFRTVMERESSDD